MFRNLEKERRKITTKAMETKPEITVAVYALDGSDLNALLSVLCQRREVVASCPGVQKLEIELEYAKVKFAVVTKPLAGMNDDGRTLNANYTFCSLGILCLESTMTDEQVAHYQTENERMLEAMSGGERLLVVSGALSEGSEVDGFVSSWPGDFIRVQDSIESSWDAVSPDLHEKLKIIADAKRQRAAEVRVERHDRIEEEREEVGTSGGFLSCGGRSRGFGCGGRRE